jgi:ankyrin repeat protein
LSEKGANNWEEGLMYAFRGDHNEVVDFLMQLLVDRGSTSNIVLGCACYEGRIDLVEKMIEVGELNWRVGMVMACQGDRLDIVRLMIENGADDWNNGLLFSCRGKHLEIIELMIEKGATECNCGKTIEEHLE